MAISGGVVAHQTHALSAKTAKVASAINTIGRRRISMSVSLGDFFPKELRPGGRINVGPRIGR
jgi:hypothetical protein